MIFSSIDELRQLFIRRSFVPGPEFEVEGIAYHFSKANDPPVDKIIHSGWNMFMLYTINPGVNAKRFDHFAQANQWQGDPAKPGQVLAFMWKWNPNIKVIMPVNVRQTSIARLMSLEQDRETMVGEQQSVGLTTKVEFVQIGATVPAKIDTGATISSLHADNWQVNGQAVVFSSSALERTLTVPMVGQHDVHTSDGGVERRPVISLDIKVNGQLIQDVHFNLNDRENMDFPVLLGQNALKQGQMMIDPTAENIDWTKFDQLFEGDDFPQFSLQTVEDSEKIKEAIDILEKNDVSLGSLMRLIRTRALEKLEC